jgi:hypothetical protein
MSVMGSTSEAVDLFLNFSQLGFNGTNSIVFLAEEFNLLSDALNNLDYGIP